MQIRPTLLFFSYRTRITLPSLRFGGSNIVQTNSSNFLGLYLDENLKYDIHVDHIACKISKSLGILNKLKHIFPTNIMLTLYYTLIYPYLTYLLECW